ncbi:MAG TPA: hypothetical protein VIX12_09590 [Candidatus Binataceae bacterium]
MFRSFLRAQFFGPLQFSRIVVHLPQFIRVFYRLMHDRRVSILAKSVPFLALLILITPPALELDLIPIVGELDWLLVGYIALRLFLWLCPPEVVREHVSAIGHGE